MRSALIISPTRRGESYESAFKQLLSFVHMLASVLDRKCELLIQHSLIEQRIAIMITAGDRHYGDHGESFEEAVCKTIDDIGQKVSALRGITYEVPKSNDEPKARSKSGTRSRRKSTGRKRSYGSRKRRR